MDQVTTGTGPVPEDEHLERFGYRQQFVRSLRHLASFAVAVIGGALIWLAYELCILIRPTEFRDAQYYVLGALGVLGVGLVFDVAQLITEPQAMRTVPGQDPS